MWIATFQSFLKVLSEAMSVIEAGCEAGLSTNELNYPGIALSLTGSHWLSSS